MEKNKYIELRKKLVALAATGAIAITGCGAKTNTNNTTSNNTVSIASVTTTTEETTTTQVETHADIATVDYMNNAKSVTKAIYDANKEYFDERQYTPEDLENVYYVLNGKYYDNEKNIIMDRSELKRAFVIMLELANPQRVEESVHKQKELDYELKDSKEYFAEIAESKFFDYSKTSLSNFIDKSEDNNDVREFFNEYSKMMNQVILNLKNGVSPEEILKSNLVEQYEAETGNISDKSVYKSLNNFLGNNTTTKAGQKYMVAAMCKATADLLAATSEKTTLNIKTKDGKEVTLLISFPYDIQYKVNAYRAGELTDDKMRLEAMKWSAKQYQEMYFRYMCTAQNTVTDNFGYEPVKEKNLTK